MAEQAYQQELSNAKGSLTREFVGGTEEQRAELFNTLNAAALASAQGSFAGIPEDQRSNILSVLDKFANVTIPGLGITGRQAQQRIFTNEMMQAGFDPATAAQLAKDAAGERVPIDKRMADQIKEQEKVIRELLNLEMQHDEQMRANEILRLDREEEANNSFIKGVENFRQGTDDLREALGLILRPRQNNDQPPIGQNAPPNLPPNGNQAPPNNGQPLAGGQNGNQQPPQGQGPIAIDMQGQQEITVRLPDIQALANGVITSMVYNAISETFSQIADTARNANPQNFEDLINSIEEGATSVTTVNFGGNGSSIS